VTTLDWLARTKLIPPLLRGDVIARPRLLALLSRALADHPLTLLSAPAGSGKTTLLASLLATLAEGTEGSAQGTARPSAPQPETPAAASVPSSLYPVPSVAWLSLDEDDDDAARFFAGLIGALQRLGPDVAAALAPQLDALPQLVADPRRLAVALVNALVAARPEPTLLLLDDLHHIKAPPIHAALEALLERPPPLLRVLIATRTDPPVGLARLRARRQVFELRLDDLRFTADETAELLQRLCSVALPAPQLSQLHRRTEGWAAGLSMLASSLARILAPGDRAAFLAGLQQSDQYIFEFLAEEVLNRQDPPTRAFLLETAVLSELTPRRCRAISGRPDAPAILDELYRRNLFLTVVPPASGAGHSAPGGEAAEQPLADYGQRAADEATYRYHDLFREFLLARLAREAPEWLVTLHQRAAATEPNHARRVEHLLDAGLWAEAARAIEAAGQELLDAGAFTLLAGWIDALPPEHSAAPWLLYLRGICAWERYELEAGNALIEQARRRFAELGDEQGHAVATVRLAVMHLNTADWTTARTLADKALAGPLAEPERLRVLGLRAQLRITDGDIAGGIADLDDALALAEAASPQASLGLLEFGASGPTTALPGSPRRVARIERLLVRLQRREESPAGLQLLELRAFAALWGGRWEQALDNCARLYAICDRLGVPRWRMVEIGALPPVCLVVLGRHEEADDAFASLFAAIASTPPAAAPLLEVPFRFWLGRARWLQGRLDEVRAAYERILAIDMAHGAHPFTEAVRPLLRGLIALGEGRHQEAIVELRTALAAQERQRYSVIFCDARLLLAYALLQAGDQQAALAAAEPAFEEWAAELAPGHVLWDGAPALQVLQSATKAGRDHGLGQQILPMVASAEPSTPPEPPSPATELAETLTSREVDVLRLMVAGARNSEIAERLVISQHTVKNHVKNILGKLDARSRTEAAARARELGLL
jgi:LuxR family maltose regulon positive regulatory protein